MLGLKKLPVGFESFQEIRKLDCYYVDKTKLIEQLLENWSKVNLFTRPRRFGKTLNMSMIKSFLRLVQMQHCLMVFISRIIRNFAGNIWESTRLCAYLSKE